MIINLDWTMDCVIIFSQLKNASKTKRNPFPFLSCIRLCG